MTGCWQTASGVEETWVQSKHGDQLFGFSVTSQGDQRVFFEQLRIDVSGDQATLHAYPKGVGPTSFLAELDRVLALEFVNAHNDYPQRIRYGLVEGRLHATIALLDNSKQNSWIYERCR
ncbi:MAG: DUF6265 family protein [Gammaproteobacteria bacterium]